MCSTSLFNKHTWRRRFQCLPHFSKQTVPLTGLWMILNAHILNYIMLVTANNSTAWWQNNCIYSNARLGFFLTFGAKIREVVLNLHMMCRSGPRQTQSLWTGPCRVKPRPSLPNHHVTATLFWDITQQRAVIPYQHFGSTYQPPLQRSRNANGRTEHNWS